MIPSYMYSKKIAVYLTFYIASPYQLLLGNIFVWAEFALERLALQQVCKHYVHDILFPVDVLANVLVALSKHVSQMDLE